jgi:glycosyltransferase involved in cell wall biosynthesis
VRTPVAFVLDEFFGPVNGTEAQFWLLYQALIEQGAQIPVWTLRPSSYLADKIPSLYHTLDVQYLFTLRATWRAFTGALRLRRMGVRVAHLYLNDVAVLLPLFLRLAGIHVIVSRRDLGFWYTPAVLRVLAFNRHFVTRVIANCQAVSQVVQEKEGYRAREVAVIPNGVVPPTQVLFERYREQHGVPGGAFVLGMLANLRALKRVDDSIAAVAALERQGIEAWLMVAGENRVEAGVDQQMRLTALAQSLGVAARIIFVGTVNPSWSFLHEIDVFLSCSDTEGLSNSIIEAMIARRAVVATNVGGTPDLVAPGTTGYLYAVGDVAALTDHLARLANNPVARWQMGMAGAARAQERYSVVALRGAHERLYSELLQDGGR